MEMKLKIFQTTQKCLAVIGFAPNQQQNDRNRRFNSKQIIIVTVCTLSTIDFMLYVLLVANDIEDRMDAIYSLTAVAGATIAFVSIIFRIDELFNFIELIEIELTDRKC